jgi:hypothetical protein
MKVLSVISRVLKHLYALAALFMLFVLVYNTEQYFEFSAHALRVQTMALVEIARALHGMQT